MELILASASPRRKELLQSLGYEFKIILSDESEDISPTLSPSNYTKTLAFKKAESVFKKYGGECLGADTVVYFNGEYLLKPKNKEQAFLMLKKLSGNTHKVVTGYAFITKDKNYVGSEETLVTFNNLTDDEITSYVNSNLWVGKAGGYGIQDGFNLVKEIKGSYDNVVGLPTERLKVILKEFYGK